MKVTKLLMAIKATVEGRKVKDAPFTLKGQEGVLRVQRKSVKGDDILDVRFWYEDEDGEYKPSRSGLSFEIDEISESDAEEEKPRRGRPPKKVEAEEPVKRGRGRPPKKVEAEEPVKRGRGRPPKKVEVEESYDDYAYEKPKAKKSPAGAKSSSRSSGGEKKARRESDWSNF